jgi:hypothetical protein
MGKVFKKITKPIAKVLDKVVPNEIKPALPFIAAAFPFLAPGLMGSMAAGLGSFGITNPMIQRALISGGLNLASQSSQEGAAERGINPLSLALAAGTGAFSGPGATETLKGAQTVGTSAAGNISAADLAAKYPGIDSAAQLGYSTDLSMLDQAKNLGLEGLSKIAAPLERGANADLFSLDKLQAVAGPLTLTASEQAYNAALDAQREFELANQGFQDFTGQQLADFSAGRKAAILASMGRAGFGEDEISATLAQLGLRNGGRVGFEMGGDVSPTDSDEEGMGGVIYYDEEGKPISQKEAMEYFNRQAEEEYRQKNNKAMGGIISLMGGGMPSMEMDYRSGGFIPVGAKERADDVPARLSKNEFVMTADAVRAAGGGSVNEGARRMYELMNNLEARA